MNAQRYSLLTETLYTLEEMIKHHKKNNAPQKEYKVFIDRKNDILSEFYDAGHIDNKQWQDWLLNDEMPFINIPEEYLEKAVKIERIARPTYATQENCKIKMVEVEYYATVTGYDYGERNIFSGPFDKPTVKKDYFKMNIHLDPGFIWKEHEIIIGRMIKSSFINFENHINEETSENG